MIRFITILFLFPIFAFGSVDSKKICLTMIVKNESKIIERCLESVKDIVDCISIADTGSSDNTVELIEAFMKKNKIPGEVHHHTWKNFGHNRTLSVQAAKETLKRLGFDLARTHFLFIDADMIVRVEPEFDKNALTEDGYHVIQETYCTSYRNIRLALAQKDWKSVGVTHEVWCAEGVNSVPNFDTLWIDDRGDGGAKSDKFERDLALLTAGIAEEPENERYMFYLAQTYKCLGQFDEAIEWYQKRADKGGWYEEVFYAQMMIGECYEAQGQGGEAVEAYLLAFNSNPARAEPLQHLARYYRERGDHALAFMYAKHGKMIPYPKEQRLFISKDTYHYDLDQEISISAFYTPFRAEGFAALNRVLLKRDVPWHVKNLALQNAVFYLEPLGAKIVPVEVAPPKITDEITFNPTNPSIRRTDNGYEVICRTVSYQQQEGKYYSSMDPNDPGLKTRNFLLTLDKTLHTLSQKEILDFSERERYPHSLIHGLEDCRLFSFNGTNHFTCTFWDAIPVHSPQIGLGVMAEDATAVKMTRLKPGYPSECEKNWLPFVHDGEIHILYSHDPFTLLKPNAETGECETVVRYTPIFGMEHFRGSAGPIAFDDGYLVAIHEVAFSDRRYYLHRFVYLDKDFQVTKVSAPFYFKDLGIEFCCGMTLDHDEKNLVITFGLEDREAYIGIIDLESVKQKLYHNF